MEEVKDELDNYTSVAEKWANHVLTCQKADFTLKEKSEDAFRDMLYQLGSSIISMRTTLSWGIMLKWLIQRTHGSSLHQIGNMYQILQVEHKEHMLLVLCRLWNFLK